MEYNQIVRDIKNKKYYPIYLLSGDEDYYIDQISTLIEESVLDENEKEFNQTILYGLDSDVLTVESVAKRYPMMASYNVVIVKEAQNLKRIEDLGNYAKNPSSTTILVLCVKNKKVDGRSAFTKEVKKSGVFFTSKRLYDNQASPWIDQYLKGEGFSISPKASLMLVEFLGTDLSKISNELDKLILNLSPGYEIDPKTIEENIGISKDYNVFELNSALGERNVLKANRIILHFGRNEKSNPIVMILPAMYRFFSQLLLYHTVKTLSNREIAAKLGVNPFFVSDYQKAAKNYSIKKIARVISSLRKADLQSKGIGSSLNSFEILQELVFEILH